MSTGTLAVLAAATLLFGAIAGSCAAEDNREKQDLDPIIQDTTGCQLISPIGSERATSGGGNKIVTFQGKTHVVWQDVTEEGYFKEWLDTFTELDLFWRIDRQLKRDEIRGVETATLEDGDAAEQEADQQEAKPTPPPFGSRRRRHRRAL